MRNRSERRHSAGRIGTLALATLLALTAAGRGQLLEKGPVEDLRRTLQANTADPAVREHDLQQCMVNIRTMGELREALSLPQWFDQEIDAQLANVDRSIWKANADRFEQGARSLLWEGDTNTRLAMIQLLVETGSKVRDLRGRGGLAQRFGPDLADLVRRGPPPVQQAAARALGLTNATAPIALPALASLLQKDDPSLRQAAAEGLRSLLGVASRLAVHPRTGEGVSLTADEWVALCCAALPVCSSGLRDSQPRVRFLCLAAVEEIGGALDELTSGARAEGHERQRDAESQRLLPVRLALAQESAVIAGLLHDPDAEVRSRCHRCLESLASASLAPAANAPSTTMSANSATNPIQKVNYLQLPPDARNPVAGAMSRTVEEFLGGLSDPDARTRRAALEGLEKLGPAAAPAAAVLARSLEDPDLFIRWGAARILGKVAPAGAEQAVPALTKLVWDRDFDLAMAATLALGRYGATARSAVPTLAEALAQPDAERRIAVLQALGGMGAEARIAVPNLRAALNDTDPRVRRASAQLLGRIGPDAREAQDALRRALSDRDPGVRTAAGAALVQISGK